MENQQTTLVTKGGTSRTGANRDRGSVVHVVAGDEPNGFWGTPALCGSEPGRKRGSGWSAMPKEYQGFKEVTCPRCRKKLGLPKI